MREFFSQFGKVVDATVMLDRETGRSKGFGFVSFENVNVEPMLGFGNLQIDGKLVSLSISVSTFSCSFADIHVYLSQIDVKLAQPRSQREAYAEGGGQGNGRGGYGTQNYTGGGGAGAYGGICEGGIDD